MNVMIPINYDGEQPTVSARALHTGLEVSRRFSVWFETNSQGFVENEDYTSVRESTEVRNNGGVQMRELQDYSLTVDMAKHICLVIAMKVCGILIKNISKARNEICKFFANCMEWDNGTAVTADDVKKFKLKQFVVMVKDFAKKDDLMDFFEGVAELVGTEQNDSMNAATVDMATPTAI